jgi:HlyD family secretion protein
MKSHHFLSVACLLVLTSCGIKDTEADASGTFESTEIIVSSETAGKILKLDMLEGQEVKASEALGIIDTVQLYLKKVQLQSSIQAAQSRRPDMDSQLAGLKQQLETANIERDRFEKLLKANAANQKQLDDINAQIKLLEKQLNAQQTLLEKSDQGISDETTAMSYQMEQINDQLSKSYICSPIDGTILVKYAEAGELATPGKPLFKVADLDNMYLKAYITTDQLSTLKIGQEVEVVAEFSEKDIRKYIGKVSWISSKSEFTPKTVQTRNERANLVYAVKVLVENDGYLKIGMYGGLRFGSKD